MTLKDMKNHLTKNADPHGNLWCHCEGCVGTYTPYRVNTWGLRNTETNKEDGRDMVQQQVTNVLRQLQKAHGMSVLTAYSDKPFFLPRDNGPACWFSFTSLVVQKGAAARM